MISEAAADRVEQWVQAALDGGARRPVGGRREGKLVWPTVLTHTRPEMKVMKDEVFGPVVSVVRYDTFEDGLQRLGRHARTACRPASTRATSTRRSPRSGASTWAAC